MEAKVHEATNNEAWGASSTLMQEIAQGTFNYQYFNEIMPTLYKRFTEKEATQWRQIYKALVLLEYLVKNGSERVVDDARSHISMIKVMRSFHYIDDKGKDQGVNIRNRAKELADLLSDTECIKSERKKAKKNRNKYIGVGSENSFGMGAGGGFSSSSGMRGFGSDSGPSSYGMGSDSFYDNDMGSSRGKYDDDDDNDFDSSDNNNNNNNKAAATTATQQKPVKASDLLDFDEPAGKNDAADDWGDFTTGHQASALDDFDDFQSALPSTTTSSAPTFQPTSTTTPASSSSANNNLLDLLGDDTFSAPTSSPNNGSAPPLMAAAPMRPPSMTPPSLATSAPAPSQQSSNALPGGIWSQASSFVSLDSLGKSNQPAKTTTGPSMNAMKSSSVNAGWQSWATNNTSTPPPTQPTNNKPKSSLDDLLF
ncbi:ENTH-domain-containing protein [Hesseltinella vesiculosa]|uniref:ENTH-domain-containing protein n=1 Tax=Hesseltinella vesiculosa TaxID=101127 RepID=A0A1X2GBS1_9FUNG|nr:ENTH-domain-containing protein [Hesseltinella vesiculosa]